MKNRDLIGIWELTEAWRSNKKIETLDGTYYVFGNNGQMSTNFNSQMENEYEYVFDGRQITQKGEQETIYQIDSLTHSVLILSTTLRKFPFKMTLAKKQESEEMPTTEL